MSRRAKVKEKTRKAKVWLHVMLVESQDILLETVGGTIFDRLQARVGQQQANVSQQSSSAKTKPVARRIENGEPIIFDLRERDDEVADHGIRSIHFYIGDDDDVVDDDDEPEVEVCRVIDVSDDEPIVRRLGEEHEDVASIIDSGADVALFPSSMAGDGGGELEFSAKTKLQDAQGSRIPTGIGGCEKKFPCVTLMDVKFSKRM